MRSASPSNASPRSKPPARTPCGERVQVRRAAAVVDVDAVGIAGRDLVLDAEAARRPAAPRSRPRRWRSRRARAGRAPRSACRPRRRPRPRSARPRRRAAATRRRPRRVGRSRSSAISASTRSSSSSSSLKPSAPNSLMPLSGNGLCEAEMTAPRLAPCSRTSQAMPGVGSTPARSATPPAEAMPAHSASSSIGPGATRVAPDDDDRRAPRRARARSSAEARPSASATSGLSTSPFATPRTPSVPNRRPATGGFSASRTAGGAVRP